ncbi:N-acetylmuramoyl-L-alanine amidase [Nonomuraea indica]|uniref:N-acetylmuramoyl-L-alanine amidase n=1 Tax=Nonomuraea indica TaxID=1581193 RepID=UPI001FE85DC4|nr:peptidoglycan recognition family protein [Nonomuraea indica]
MLQWVVAGLTAGALVGPVQDHGRQGDFAEAAREYGVPVSVLLGVSYLQSRWDSHAGRPSTDGGYGPMHLVDLETAARPEGRDGHAGHGGQSGHHGHGSGDARGDGARPAPERSATAPDRDAGGRDGRAPAGGSADGSARGAAGGSADGPAGGPAGGPAPWESEVTGPSLRRAARLTGLPAERLRTDPAANIRGGAALLAAYQPHPTDDPAGWYQAVVRYSGARDPFTARSFADEVFTVIREGAARRTDDGFAVRLAAAPGLRPPAVPPLRRAQPAECPATLACEWMPAAYRRTGGGDYGNHDRIAGERRVDYIVIHDTEGSYDGIKSMVADPDYVSWHYTVRSRDGHVAQHVRTNDVAWHAGNWDVNTRSIGVEHEGYLAKGGAWYTEAMYRASARLVRHLADLHDIPLDRAHILGHDNVPGTTPETLPGMHDDPGPYWDWAHYFDLMGSPLHADGRSQEDLDAARRYAAPPASRTQARHNPAEHTAAEHTAAERNPAEHNPAERTAAERNPAGRNPASHAPASRGAGETRAGEAGRRAAAATKSRAGRADGDTTASVVILPDYGTNQPAFTGCVKARPTRACEPHGASTVWLRTEPREDAPLVDDVGKRVGKPSTSSVYDHSARVSTGQRFAVAGTRGDWTAIWYLGRKAWFHNPPQNPTAVPADGPLVMPLKDEVEVYGRAFPGRPAYRGTGVDFQERIPLPYVIRPGQAYALGHTVRSSYLSAGSYDPGRHVTVTGRQRYHQIQLGHRVMYVKARDVRVVR